jgi:hypothetical protein
VLRADEGLAALEKYCRPAGDNRTVVPLLGDGVQEGNIGDQAVLSHLYMVMATVTVRGNKVRQTGTTAPSTKKAQQVH